MGKRIKLHPPRGKKVQIFSPYVYTCVAAVNHSVSSTPSLLNHGECPRQALFFPHIVSTQLYMYIN